MATFFFAIGIDPSTAVDPNTDGMHLDGQYGFAVDNGNGQGPKVLGSGSGSSGRQFESVQLNLRDGSNRHQFYVLLFSNVTNIAAAVSYLRIAFRPGHNVPPAANVDASPLAGNDTESLTDGVLLTACSPSLSGGGNGLTYGLPSAAYQNTWQFPAYTLNGPPNSEASFELTAEVTVVSGGTTYYFKVDPEMMIDF